MNGALPLLPLPASMAWTGTAQIHFDSTIFSICFSLAYFFLLPLFFSFGLSADSL
jgi:hypothetical protein